MREAVLVQRAVVDHLPQAPASRCFRILASRLAGLGRGRRRPAPGRRRDGPCHRLAGTEASAVRVKACRRSRRSNDRDRLVMEHVDLVKTLAQRLAQRLPSQVELNELVSVGVLGLIDAADALPAVARRAVRRVRAAAHSRRDARRAARARLGAALGAPPAPRHGRGDRDAAARLGREPRKQRSPTRWTCRSPEYEQGARPAAHARSRLGASARRADARRHAAPRAVHRPAEDAVAQLERKELRAHLAQRDSRSCPSASGTFSRSTTRRS